MLLPIFNINLPLQVETALSMIIWVYVGIYSKTIFMKLENHKILLILVFITSTILGLIFGRLNNGIMVMLDHYGKNIFLYFFASLSWIIVLTTLSIIIGKCKIMESVGKNTLIILLVHKFPILFFQKVCPLSKDWLKSNNFILEFTTRISISIIVIIMCLIFDKCLKILKDKYISRKNELNKYNNTGI